MAKTPWTRARLLAALLASTITACSADAIPTAEQSQRIAATTTIADGQAEPEAPPPVSAPTVATSTPAPSTIPAPADGEDGDDGLGDPYFDGLGNGGYDVAHYDLALDVDVDQNHVEGTATISARALADLASFSLDLHGLDVGTVTVGGADAEFDHAGDELRVTPPSVIADGAEFTVTVDYAGVPQPLDDETIGDTGWRTTGDVIYVIAEPNGAATWFPANDHPSDKATFSIAVTIAESLTAISNGRLTSSSAAGNGTRTWRWEMDDPMATYLATVVIDEFEIIEGEPVGDVEIRDAIPDSRSGDAELDGLGGRHTMMLEYFESLFGDYPFDAYGIVLVDEYIGLAMETQSISLFSTGIVNDEFLSHELAHQWFGDSVSPATWRDIWLNEGFATYAQWLWSDHTGGQPVDTAAGTVHANATRIDYRVDLADPGPGQLFDTQMYDRGALALHALRLTVGDDVFFATLRTWVDRYRYGNASVPDFIAVAEEMSGTKLDDFFVAWLGTDAPPPLPR